MSADSSVAGYLQPTGALPPPLEDDALDDFLQEIVVGITGLAGTLVRPRWQESPPNLPPRSVNWAAIGVNGRSADTFAVEQHDPAGNGTDQLIRHEVLTILLSCYGPNCQGYATLLRDGLSVAQNREVLFLANMGLIGVGDVTQAPELIKELWYQRADVSFEISREVKRVYPVLNLLSAPGVIETDAGNTSTFNATGP